MLLTRRTFGRLAKLSGLSIATAAAATEKGTASEPAPASPAILSGAIELGSFPGLVAGPLRHQPNAAAIRIANGRVLQAGLNAAAAAGKFIEEGHGLRIEYAAHQVQEGRNVGLQVPYDLRAFIGSGPGSNGGSQLIQFARNHPVITLGDVGSSNNLSEGCTYKGFRVGYGVGQQGQDQASTILIGRGFACRYEDLFEDSFMMGSQPYQGMIGLHFFTATGQFTFSNILKNIKIHRAQRNLLRTGAVGTGNVWENVYLGGGTFGSRVPLSGAAVHFANNWASQAAGAISQLNIEWVEANQFLFLEAVRTGSFNSLRFEGCKMVGQSPTLISATASTISIRALVLVDTWIGAEAKGTPSIVSSDFNSQISIDGVEAKWSGPSYNSEAVVEVSTHFVDVGREYNNIEIANVAIEGGANCISIDTTLSNTQFGDLRALGRYSYRKLQSHTENSVIMVTDADHINYGAHRNPIIRYSGPLTADRTVTITKVIAPAGLLSSVLRPNDEIVVLRRDETAIGPYALIVQDSSGIELGRLTTANAERAFLVGNKRPN